MSSTRVAMKKATRRKLLSLLRGAKTMAQLMEATGAAERTILDHLKELETEGRLERDNSVRPALYKLTRR